MEQHPEKIGLLFEVEMNIEMKTKKDDGENPSDLSECGSNGDTTTDNDHHHHHECNERSTRTCYESAVARYGLARTLQVIDEYTNNCFLSFNVNVFF